MKTFKVLSVGIMLAVGAMVASAHDFTVTVGGQKIYFNINKNAVRSVEVTYKGSIADKPISTVSGEIEIPAKVKHNNVVYSVTGIGAKAFYGAKTLTGVVLPSTVKSIGDFAFEGCKSLEKVVFPGNAVKMGEGTFFKCSALKSLSFGSEWKTLDLKPYRWSNSLEEINVPAKVEKIQNLKSLKSLKRVSVDVNNSKFASHEGFLYSKDFKTLYAIPRSYQGTAKVKEGTETVIAGAMIDCPMITLIDFPASLRHVSFRETSRMSELAQILFRAESPIVTGYDASGKGVFLLQLSNPKAKIVVLKKQKNAYAPYLVTTPGEYTETDKQGSLPYMVTANQLPTTKNIKGVKNFKDYE